MVELAEEVVGDDVVVGSDGMTQVPQAYPLWTTTLLPDYGKP